MTYSDLVVAVATMTHRTDLAAVVELLIVVVETKLNRRLRVRQMEKSLPTSAVAGYELAIPTDWVETKALWNVDAQLSPITSKPSEYVRNNQTSGAINYAAVEGQKWRFDVAAGSVAGVYYSAIPSIGPSVESNWLIASNPDLYLFATLAEVEIYSRDDAAAALWAQRTESLISELNNIDMASRYSGPLELR